MAIAGSIFLIAWANYMRVNANSEKLIVEIDQTDEPALVSEEEVKTEILEEIPAVIGSSAKNIKLEEIEKQVSRNTQLTDVKAFLDISGNIHVKAKPRKAILRIFDENGAHLYLGEDKIIMDHSLSQSHRILVANGNIPHLNSERRMNILKQEEALPEIYDQLYKLANLIEEDEFLNTLINQIYIKKDQKAILTPKLGVKKIEFGSLIHMEEKLFNLKAFYLYGNQKVDWQKYDAINIEFENQIVCSKK
jgi:cell division protein FtsQ